MYLFQIQLKHVKHHYQKYMLHVHVIFVCQCPDHETVTLAI